MTYAIVIKGICFIDNKMEMGTFQYAGKLKEKKDIKLNKRRDKMVSLTAIEYDECRRWIKRRRAKGESWDRIRLALKTDERELEGFLKTRIEEDYWPQELDVDCWKELVQQMEDAELRRIQIQQKNRMAELHDGQYENNRVEAPIDERSSWQLYKQHLKENKHFSDEAIQNIEEASIGILKRLSTNTVDIGPIKGLVIGNVQSGKTANMAGLMAMAADWRWNMFIVLSGTIESLRKQTQNRLYGDLNHPGNLVWIPLEHLSKKKSPEGQRLYNLQLQSDSPMRYMTVCLKVKSRLEDLIEWIEVDKQNIKNLRILVIDDEADQAGVNTGDVYSEKDRKTINKLILNLVHCRDKKATSNANNTYDSHYQAMNYISYTATPYANCLNEIGPETLYPRNFIRTLAVPRAYFGPDKFFGATDADHDQRLDVVRAITDDDVKKIKQLHYYGGGELPNSLKDSIRWFLCAASMIRYYGYRKPVSMLVHTSQKQADHKAIADSIKKWLTTNSACLIEECELLYNQEIARFTKRSLREVYPDYELHDNEIWDYPDFSELKKGIQELSSEISSIMMDEEGDLQYCKGIHICIDNCANNGLTDDGAHMRLAYPDEKSSNYPNFAAAFIVVGGNTLSRGLTLEGLVSTFFLRSVKQADTLMQMGRWFGYRTHYELLQRVWLTSDTVQKFEFLSDIDLDLREQIYQMQLIGKGPEDFNVTLLTSPKVSWLSLTAKKKMQMATAAGVDFSGMDPQLTVYSKDKAKEERNVRITRDFLLSLGVCRKSDCTEALVWENVEFKTISEGLFEKGFYIPATSQAFQQMDLLKEWIEKQTVKGEMKKWNVILCGRKITDNLDSDKIWSLSEELSIGKVERSCRSDSGDHINIGILTGKKDYLADITPSMLDKQTWMKMTSSTDISKEFKDYRKSAGVDKTPLFLIYVIDKNSKATSRGRKDLNLKEDLIGLAMVIPGVRGSRGTVTRLKVKPLAIVQEVEE